MNKVQSFNRSLLDLPSEVIWQILCMLPIKTCLTCKLVCKDWYEIITNPCFSDLRRHYRSGHVTLMIYCYFPNRRKNFMLVELDKSSDNVVEMGNNISSTTDARVRFKSKFDEQHNKLNVVNDCNGLVCLRSHPLLGRYYICNLLTSQYVAVDDPTGHCGMICGYGFGFCAVTRQYKVLRFLETQRSDGYMAEILTLGTHYWKRVGVALDSYYQAGPLGPSLYSSLHWYGYRSNRLWAFHFSTERFLPLPTPDEFGQDKPRFSSRMECELTVLDSCLCFCCISHDDFQSEVWVMKEYGVKDSWVKQFVIQKGPWALPFVALARMDDGKVLLNGKSHLGLYEPETGAYRRVKIDGVSFCGVCAFDVDFSHMLGVAQASRC